MIADHTLNFKTEKNPFPILIFRSPTLTSESPFWGDTCIDTSLSLIIRNCEPLPAAPLRSACEDVARAIAVSGNVTRAMIEDLARVVGKASPDDDVTMEQSDDDDEDEDNDDEKNNDGNDGDDNDDGDAEDGGDSDDDDNDDEIGDDEIKAGMQIEAAEAAKR